MPAGACPELVEREPASPFLLLLEGRFPLEAGMTDEEEDEVFLTEEEDFAEDELYGSPPLCSEDDNDEEDSSTSGAELLLSSPQATRNAEPHKTAVTTVNFPKNFILLS